APDVEIRFAKARAEGTHPTAIVGAALRQVAQLHRARLAVESGTPAEDAIPGLHFSRKRLVAAAVSSCSPARLERVMAQHADAPLEGRGRRALAEGTPKRPLRQTATMARRKM